MREILFRGKRIDNGRWEEGYFLKYALIYEEQTYILPLGSVCDSGIEIDPETVCQYTGLTDRNGRKIFEGDILSHDGVGNIKVQFKKSEFLALGITHDMFSTLLSSVYKDCEVIGNIFDNPELIN